MAGLGIRYHSGPKRVLEFEVASAYSDGDVLILNGSRRLAPYSNTTQPIVGIAEGSSVNSIPSGKGRVLLALPDTVFTARVYPGVAASSLSVGQSWNVERGPNGTMSYLTTAASGPATIVAPVNSDDSTVPVVFTRDALVIPSNASDTI